jgi:hypothetical protein
MRQTKVPDVSDKSPSPMLVYLDDALEGALPESELSKLNAHDDEVAKTTSHHDLHRCFRCAEWAVDLLSPPEHSHLRHLVHKLEKVLHEVHDSDWAMEFGMFVSRHPVLDEELTWVDDAVAAAKAVAEKAGWDSVPWEALLIQLIAMEPQTSSSC